MFSAGQLAAMTATVEETLGSGRPGWAMESSSATSATTLAAQPVRIVRPGGVGRNVVATDGTSSAQWAVEVVGLPALDVRAATSSSSTR